MKNNKFIIEKNLLHSIVKKNHICDLVGKIGTIGEIIGLTITSFGSISNSKKLSNIGLSITAVSITGKLAAQSKQSKNLAQLERIDEDINYEIINNESNLTDQGYNFEVGM